VPPGDPSSMAQAIQRLLRDDGLRARLAAAGRTVALEEYDVTRLIPRVERLYETAMGDKLQPKDGRPGGGGCAS